MQGDEITISSNGKETKVEKKNDDPEEGCEPLTKKFRNSSADEKDADDFGAEASLLVKQVIHLYVMSKSNLTMFLFLLLFTLKDILLSRLIENEKQRYVETICRIRRQFKFTLELLDRTLQHPFIVFRGLHLTPYYAFLKQEIKIQAQVSTITAETIFDVELLDIHETVNRIHFASLNFLYLITPDLLNLSDPVSYVSFF